MIFYMFKYLERPKSVEKLLEPIWTLVRLFPSIAKIFLHKTITASTILSEGHLSDPLSMISR